MAAVGGMLAAAILKVVGDQIGSVIGGQIKLQKNLDEDLNGMKMTLESIEAVLKVGGRQAIIDEQTRLWLKRLTVAMYDISSLIDKFEDDTQAITEHSVLKSSPKKQLLRLVSCLHIGPKFTVANEMKMMRDKLNVIADQHHGFTLLAGTSTIQLSVTDIRETSSTMGDEEHIVGRRDVKNKILACLSESMTKEFTVLPIYGIGGVGKTTLAKTVFNDSQFRDYSQVWIYVSQTFDLNKIGNSIISQISKEKSPHTEKQMIHNSLRGLLTNGKILIVLDDLWEENESQLKDLLDMLKLGQSGKVVVIVTTRYEGIATRICTIESHKLAPLPDDQCWAIIMQKSDFKSRYDQEELQHIGMDIASKCGGVALAAQTIGHMLHSLPFDEWESVRNSDFWNLSDPDDTDLTHVLPSLKLSYSVMPSYLQICFAYCAIFPKGYKIVKDDLIHQWISLGFIKADTKSSTWQLGEKCIRQLLGLSFLEHSKSALNTGVNFENGTSLTMHDLVHDLARLVMVDEILVAGKQGSSSGRCWHFALLNEVMVAEVLINSKQGNSGGSCCHFASLNDRTMQLELSKIRALCFMECTEIELHGVALSSAKSMRVLDLSECSILKLSNSIGDLKQLRYLNAPRVQDAKIPDSITKLSKLIYLNLHGSPKILALPESIGEIEGLMYLDLSGCSGIAKLPESFGRLKELVHLDLSMCCIQKLPQTLGRFIKLKYLNLSCCQKITELPIGFGSLRNLVHVDLSGCSDVASNDGAFFGLTNLQYLNLKDTSFTSPQLQRLTKLKYLNLSALYSQREHQDIFDRLFSSITLNQPDLEHLDLSDNSAINLIPVSLYRLKKLHTLDLSGCVYLKKIEESKHTISSLKFLYLRGCVNLDIDRIPQLGGSTVSLPRFGVRVATDESSSNLVLLQPTDPIELHITELENAKSAGEAHSIKLMEKRSLQDLELVWTPDVKRFMDDKILLEELVPPCTLKKLEIRGYNSVSLPAWLVDQLPNLELLVLRDMENLEEWNTSYSCAEEHVIQTLEIHNCPMLRMKPPLLKAKSWKISDSDNVLSSWNDCTVSHTGASSSSPITTMLSVQRYRGPHQWRLLQHFPALSSLSIIRGYLNSSPEIIGHLSYLKTICLSQILMLELPQWLGEVTSLHNLELRSIDGLEEFNESMRQLQKLQSLKLISCKSLSLPHWLGELTYLKELSIDGNGVLRSLPASLQQNSSIQKIQISDCPNLEDVIVESEEGTMELAHNQESVCVLPTSLRELKISHCQGIMSLPEGIQQLTNLQSLVISSCPELRQWCESEENRMKLAHIENMKIWS
ncbi:unnamed protein product [Triticum turgidum subsp. durum]|uniref:Uncharacterized protein n=1 Tax=Triticum turgidum subsp. durum TaxID=4567 RepID=A0A9R0R8D6_TRITD|nr:unnamed protein product [Triticum turgidum subsp. durum]